MKQVASIVRETAMRMRIVSAAVVLGLGIVGLTLAQQTGERREPIRPDTPDNQELCRLYEEDQADRMPKDGKAIDPTVLIPRDREREGRIKDLYEAGKIRTGKDYHRAAMVLQHAVSPDDFLLAHEFCVVALAKGERDARWLAAATEDRFLMKIGRPQRFGTQYSSSRLSEPVKLYEVGAGVTDSLRMELGVPSLDEARRREAEMNRLFKVKKP
jgi:hypothetical protein